LTDEAETERWRDIDDLRAFVAGDVDTGVAVAAGDTADPLADFRSLALLDDAGEPFRDAARAVALAIERLKPFAPGYVPDRGEWLVIPLADHPPLKAAVERALAIEEGPIFGGEVEFVAHLRAFATILSRDGQRAAFIRRMSPRKELKRSGLVALLLTARGFNRVEDRLFLFDQEVDCIAWRGHLYVGSVAALNALVPSFEVVVERVRDTLRRVAPLVANGEAFEGAALAQPGMRSKLMQIAARPYLDRLTMKELKAQIARRKLAVEVERGDDGEERLVFDPTREKRWLILKLLDDDYLDSRMTDERYEVNSKLRS
jgi:hypothetical protein